MKITFFFSKTKQIYVKILTVPESTFKIKAMIPWILFETFFTSAFIYKLRFLHENEIVQYLQNYNTKTLIKIILENPYKVLQMP